MLVLAGCGASSREHAAAPAQAPPLQAVDEAPPANVQRILESEFGPLPANFGENGRCGAGACEYTWV